MRIFYGWWVVAACMVCSLVGNALGLFGAGVYLHEAVTLNGWTTGVVSGAVTSFYVVSALLLIPVGAGIRRYGPRIIIASGGLALAAGIIAIGHATIPFEAYLAFIVMGVGWATLSTTAIATTLAPWFDRHQGRAVSLASLGASAGGIFGPSALLFGVERIGFGPTTIVAGIGAAGIVVALVVVVLRNRPQDLGLLPDGLPLHSAPQAGMADWTWRAAVRTLALRSVVVTFGIGMMVQIGFLTHQVAQLARAFDPMSVSMIVSSTAFAALAGRIALARYSDELDARIAAAVALLVAAFSLAVMGLASSPAILVAGNILFGLTVGNVTTLSPIIVRREFGAPAFGLVFGVASCAIQLTAALGPSFYGLLHDLFGSYDQALIAGAALDVVAAAIVVAGRRKADAPLGQGPPN